MENNENVSVVLFRKHTEPYRSEDMKALRVAAE